ncbi:unnamed protein product [Adineta ricciae]|uniref:Reverse transcriptase domain-containing protein n=1 Tax=Adineta ricciae TaxID=249248 RepID=A0A816FKT8_ADIRI|nr:unnamed protein product [Adineta ricciae]CAF1662837.1 unnamed protein product [Adineta ricciae]
MGVYSNNQLLKQVEIKIRNNILQNQKKSLRWLRIDTNTQESLLKHYLATTHPSRNHENDVRWMNTYKGNFKDELMKNHQRKLRELIEEKEIMTKGNNPKLNKKNTSIPTTISNVVNISKTHLSIEHLKVLSKGLKFVPTACSIDIITNIVNTENALGKKNSRTKTAAISEITEFISKWKKPKQSNINKEEQRLLNEIKSNENLVIVQADKGGKVVVMDKKNYIDLIEQKLKDECTYEIIQKDPTKKIMEKVKSEADKLLGLNKINVAQHFQLISIEDLPTIRGQPKLHKPNNPMRIITCSKNTITSPVSKYVFHIIKELRSTISGVVTNTTSFVDKINYIPLDRDENLASLDIQDLFTNIPVTRAIDIVIHRLTESKKLEDMKLTKTDIKRLLLVALNNSYFQFNNKFYRQTKGLPMGNTLSPLIADIYMDYYIKENMKEINNEKKIFRYVDDILIITKMKENELQEYVTKLNKIRGNIKFTYEFESNNKISFLDTTVKRQSKDNHIKVNVRWFRKQTASDRFLNYESDHGRSIKRNLVQNMTTRILQTSKEKEDQIEDLETLKKMLQNSNYPIKEIDYLIQNACQKFEQKSTNTKKDDDTEFTLSLPYVKGIEVLKRKLEKWKIKLYFSYPNKLQSSFNQSMKAQSKSVVYQIQCDCDPPSIYNGETKKGLETRIKQHYSLISNEDTRSEMVQHQKENNNQCLFDTNNAFIIDQEKTWTKRRLKEAIYSKINKSINKHDDINEAWNPIMHKAEDQIKRKIKLSMENHQRYKRSKEQDGNSDTGEISNLT